MLPRLPLLTTLEYAPRLIHTYTRPLSFCACVSQCLCVCLCMDRLCVPVQFTYACIGASASACVCACAYAYTCACLCVLRAMITSSLRSCLCASLSLSLGPSLCVCVRRPHPDSEGGLCPWPRGHSLRDNNIDAALLQQIQAFIRQPAATRQAEGMRPLSSHRQS
jgi:hypothetical protein